MINSERQRNGKQNRIQVAIAYMRAKMWFLDMPKNFTKMTSFLQEIIVIYNKNLVTLEQIKQFRKINKKFALYRGSIFKDQQEELMLIMIKKRRKYEVLS